MSGQGTGSFARLGIGAQVALSAALALVAVLLVNWLAGRPGVRQRFDLTATQKNSLATATRGVLERLDDGLEPGEELTIEILYQPEEPPLTAIAGELMARTEALLALVEDESGGRVDVEVADLTDREAWRARALELRVDGFENGLLVSRGDRRTFLPLLGALAQVNFGDPARGIAPSVAAFTAEESLVEALLDVTRGERLEAYFTYGFGERDVKDETDEFQAGKLGAALEREGFRVRRWNLLEDGPLPADCDVLGILGPEQRWPEAMREAVDAYLDRGGCAVIAAAPTPADLAASDVPGLLERRGLQVSEGVLMRFVPDPATGKLFERDPESSQLWVTAQQMAPHAMLQPLRRAGRALFFPYCHEVRVARQPEGGAAQVIAWAPPQTSWLDALPLDFQYDPAREGLNQRQAGMLLVAKLPPAVPVATPLALEAELETRLAVFGSSGSFINGLATQNQDLWRAAFNWATDREHRVSVSPRDPDLRFVPRDDPAAMGRVVRFAQLWLPLGAFAIGALVALARARGGPRAPTKATSSHTEAAA